MRAHLIAGFLMLVATLRPAAAEPTDVSAAYRVTWLGFPVAEGTVEARTGADRYSVSYSFETARSSSTFCSMRGRQPRRRAR